MWRALPLIVVVALVVGGVLFWLVVSPALDRRRARLARRAARREQIEDLQHEWAVENVTNTREDLRRHRARLEGSLDDLHDPK
ncbi:hypothetical protein [Kineosporia babensis]|uniref:Uncharacterized protein n=1 Tax=Kineosporia babensis TaxID=499548 RepID=A0A9X1SYD4_9ACTN|nr:hypothetical protein [Kineosporia babensis]MCD5310888.1 hypothetical protein [Kineosporia babensis]